MHETFPIQHEWVNQVGCKKNSLWSTCVILRSLTLSLETTTSLEDENEPLDTKESEGEFGKAA